MGMVKSPIPPPILTIRSEYVTITRARGQQSLTCLITIHVPEGQWTPNPQDLRGFATASPQDASEVAAEQSLPNDEDAEHHAEVREELEDATHELLARVDNWHGLDFSRSARSTPLSFLSDCLTDLVSSSCTARFTWARISSPGRNWSVISLLRCSSVFVRRETHYHQIWTKRNLFKVPQNVLSRAPS